MRPVRSAWWSSRTSMWQREFGSDPSVVGRPLQLRGRRYTIVGVAPPAFTGVMPLISPELWLPAAHVEEVEPAGINSKRALADRHDTARASRHPLAVRQGAAAARRQRGAGAGEHRAARRPAPGRASRDQQEPPHDGVCDQRCRFLVPQAGGPLSIGSASVMAIVGLVLLIACANVTGMLLARASGRRREISVRLAIGASRRHLLRQLLCEGLVLGVCGAAVAVALAWGVIRALVGIELPIPGSIGLDLRLDAARDGIRGRGRGRSPGCWRR